MIEQLREGDTVVVYSLDRLGRTTKQLILLVEDFGKQGVSKIDKDRIRPLPRSLNGVR